MSDQPAIILHVGAPKCGARALQRALSAAPLLTTDSGTLAYTVLHPKGSGWTQLSGRALRSSSSSPAFPAMSASVTGLPSAALWRTFMVPPI